MDWYSSLILNLNLSEFTMNIECLNLMISIIAYFLFVLFFKIIIMYVLILNTPIV